MRSLPERRPTVVRRIVPQRFGFGGQSPFRPPVSRYIARWMTQAETTTQRGGRRGDRGASVVFFMPYMVPAHRHRPAFSGPSQLLSPQTQGDARSQRRTVLDRWIASSAVLIKAPLLTLVVSQRIRPFLQVLKQNDLLALKELLEAGKVTPVIDRTYPLSQAREAIGYFGEGHAHGKVVITV